MRKKKILVTNDVFWAIEWDKGMAAMLSFKSSLMVELAIQVEHKQWSKEEAVKQLKVSKTWFENASKGKMHKVTIESLIKALVKVGIRVKPNFDSL